MSGCLHDVRATNPRIYLFKHVVLGESGKIPHLSPICGAIPLLNKFISQPTRKVSSHINFPISRGVKAVIIARCKVNGTVVEVFGPTVGSFHLLQGGACGPLQAPRVQGVQTGGQGGDPSQTKTMTPL